MCTMTAKHPSCGQVGPSGEPAGPQDLGCWARERHLRWGPESAPVWGLGKGPLGRACLSRLLCSLSPPQGALPAPDCGRWGRHLPLTEPRKEPLAGQWGCRVFSRAGPEPA